MANAVPGRGSDGNTDGRRQAISLAHIGFVSQNKVARKLPSCDVGRGRYPFFTCRSRSHTP